MTNSKFSSSPQFLGLMIILMIMFSSRLFLIGALYLIAFGQMVTPHISQFVKTQMGAPYEINLTDLRAAFNEIGVVEGSLHSPDTILATNLVLSALKTPKSKSVKPGTIKNRPRKLTAKEKLAEQNWIDRTQITDWQDRDCWLS